VKEERKQYPGMLIWERIERAPVANPTKPTPGSVKPVAMSTSKGKNDFEAPAELMEQAAGPAGPAVEAPQGTQPIAAKGHQLDRLADRIEGDKRGKLAVNAVVATRRSTLAFIVGNAIVTANGYRFPAVSGQVTMETHFGQEMYRLASLVDTRLVLEIGTWNGGGSSLCIGKGLKESGTGFLFTVEAMEEQWIQAGNTLRGYPVKTILGSAVEASSISPVQTIMDGGGLPGINPKEWKKWWAGEKQLAESYLVPHLGELCKRLPFDVVVLDGAEFYGPAEYADMLAHCHAAKYVALHDTLAWKNRVPKAAMLKNSTNWRLIGDDTTINGNPDGSDKAGWAIFERVVPQR
jgi:hypothetical protein